MDPLREHDVSEALEQSPSERLRQMLEVMAWGFEMQWRKIRNANPHATEPELLRLFELWLCAND